jgi:molybdopterin-binding protein
MTVRAAADRLGVSYSALKQWIYKGTVRTVRTGGGHYRIADAEIDRLLASQGKTPGQARVSTCPRHGMLVSISGRNQLRGIVEEVRADGLLAQVRLRIGDQRLTAVITRDAVDELKLRRGEEALAIIKSTEVMIAKGSPFDRLHASMVRFPDRRARPPSPRPQRPAGRTARVKESGPQKFFRTQMQTPPVIGRGFLLYRVFVWIFPSWTD